MNSSACSSHLLSPRGCVRRGCVRLARLPYRSEMLFVDTMHWLPDVTQKSHCSCVDSLDVKKMELPSDHQ
jgi:hypothetical protein